MHVKPLSARVLAEACARSKLSQRALSTRAVTSRSVVARIELVATAPTTETLERLVHAAGFELSMSLAPRAVLDPQELDDVPRILRLSPEARLVEVGNIARFVARARRA